MYDLVLHGYYMHHIQLMTKQSQIVYAGTEQNRNATGKYCKPMQFSTHE